MKNQTMPISSSDSRPVADAIQCKIEDGIALVTLDRAEKRNALTLALWRRLGEIFVDLGERRDVRAVVLTGRGASFCAGADISEFGTVRAGAEQALEYEAAYEGCCDRIAATPKATIAAINGFCMGGGCNVAMSCDFRFAVADASFAIPAARLSIVYGVAGTRRLLSLVGLSNAKRILYSAEKFDAARALQIGFIDEIAGDALLAARTFAARLTECAPLTISGSKTMLDGLASGLGTLDEAHVRRLLEEAAQSHDYREGREAFAQKRAPRFRGE
ncbi:enoyl-CoA hydratase/isomerase family protein [Paraburkholderia acidipaludis]|uniref:enoyl-CoA hydratase/isomerase family protein n=1 Tax=Paraburkholderia acidipaludis TaxID=660537 RepID=UPI000B2587C4|nr:enoyl-CoA hydratase-related protein [Paraburkholderia acidipaludis]